MAFDAPGGVPSGNPAQAIRLTPEQAYAALREHPGWIVERRRIYRDYRFASFRAAMDFVAQVADLAESLAHHPNIVVHEWCFVRLELYSHLNDCITQADVDLAVATDGLHSE
jgi:4a-hydroxytetrahydrobiopterin dehydratase